MRPSDCDARRRPASGSCYRGQAERAHNRRGRFATSHRLRSAPILPWAFRGFSRACRVPFQRHAMPVLAVEQRGRPPIAAALPFVGCHPLVGF